MLNMFKKMLNMSKEATQSKFDNLWSNSLTAWAYSTCTQVPESTIIMSSYCQASGSVVPYTCQVL